jgi:hypothetical protein
MTFGFQKTNHSAQLGLMVLDPSGRRNIDAKRQMKEKIVSFFGARSRDG